MLDLMRNGFKNIYRKKLRSVLTVAGIAIGVMSVIIITMIGDIGKSSINSELSSMGIGGLMIRAEASKKQVKFDVGTLQMIKQNEGVEEATPLMTLYSEIKMRQDASKCIVWGIDSDTKKVVSLETVYGRMVNQSDIASLAKVCVVDENFAVKNYKRANIVGKKLEIKFNGVYQEFEVVGVAKSGGNMLQSLMGDIVPCFTYIPYTSMQNLSLSANFNQIVVKTKSGVDTTAVSSTLVSSMDSTYGTSNSVVVEDLNKQMDKLNSILDIVTMILSVIAGISLLVAGLSIMTVMLVSVSERTREIGIKKSIGANQLKILNEFLTESFLITLIGAIVGVVTGILLGIIGCLIFSLPVIINPPVILFCIVFAVVVGVLFGVYPALKASRLKPVDALRHE